MKHHFRSPSILVGLALLVAGCGTALAAEPNIAFVPKLVGIPYFSAMKQGFEQAGKKFGAHIIYQGPTTASVSGQAEIVQSLINKHVSAVGVSANSPTALEALAKQAKDHGILFYSTDSQVDGPDVDLRVQQTSNKALADAVIDQLAKAIDGKGEVAFVSGGPTATNLN
ncbi:MAG: substrate-binding domain-containing protein, partial [Acidiphilium sp.]